MEAMRGPARRCGWLCGAWEVNGENVQNLKRKISNI